MPQMEAPGPMCPTVTEHSHQLTASPNDLLSFVDAAEIERTPPSRASRTRHHGLYTDSSGEESPKAGS
ncbi:hypothetical protein FS749_000363 [Ceratobasidium sp. UAMH 11750]|nr:hypothetical protein FS749_000363 [Ceratobasidium sp. UAMH 11750]